MVESFDSELTGQQQRLLILQSTKTTKLLATAKILIWDNDGTVTGSKNPYDTTRHAKAILPGVENMMRQVDFNFIISGFKSPESEAQNFDPETVAAKFISLMEQLPIHAVTFSPNIGGIACYAIIKKTNNAFFIKKAHEESRYKSYKGQFKKPDIGMFIVMRDIAREEFKQVIDKETSIMIGDTWHDKVAAENFGIPFINATEIHNSQA